jgi:hypothetical protein
MDTSSDLLERKRSDQRWDEWQREFDQNRQQDVKERLRRLQSTQADVLRAAKLEGGASWFSKWLGCRFVHKGKLLLHHWCAVSNSARAAMPNLGRGCLISVRTKTSFASGFVVQPKLTMLVLALRLALGLDLRARAQEQAQVLPRLRRAWQMKTEMQR